MSESTLIGFRDARKWRNLSMDGDGDFFHPIHSPVNHHDFKFRIASSDRRRTAATVLARKMYSWRGYDFQDADRHQAGPLVLIADNAGEAVATMTVCVDGAAGLPADENFRDQIEVLRSRGFALWEPSRVAVVNRMPKKILAGLMHLAFMYAGTLRSCTDAVIEVNPRHVRFYMEDLGFEPFGEQRLCTRVGAPAVLLRLKMSHAAEMIHQYAGGEIENSSSERKKFYSYFFSRQDAPGILKRLSNEYL